MKLISRTRFALAAALLLLVARPTSAQITGSGLSLGGVIMSRNSVAYDPINQVYLVIVSRPPVAARFLNKNGVQIGPDFPIALEGGYTAWASIAFGGPPNDPVFLVTYTLADLNLNPKYGRLVRYVNGGAPSISGPIFLANSTSEWVHSEKGQNVWTGTKFIVGTRVMPPGSTLPTFQINSLDLNGAVSAAVNLGDGNDYYGSPSLACATNGVCMADGFMAGINNGYTGGSYGRLFDMSSMTGLGGLFYLAAGMPNEDQEVVYQSHTGRFLAEWYRGTGGGIIDTRLVNADGTMSALDLNRGFSGPGAGCNTLVYNPGTHTALLVSKNGPDATLFATELGDDGYPINGGNSLVVTGWDGQVLDYEPSIAANAVDGQWLVTAQLQGHSVGLLVQGVLQSQTILPITILTAPTMPAATQSTPYSQLLIASGSTPAYTWSLVTGAFPPGMGLAGSSLVGTPTTPGDYSFRLHVQGGDGQTADRDFSLHVSQVIVATAGQPAGSHVTPVSGFVVPGLTSRNSVAYDPIHEVYLVIVNRPPVTGRFLNKNGVAISGDFPIALEDGYTAWASIAFGGPANDPVFLVTYTIADLAMNPKVGRLVRYTGGAPSIGPAAFIANSTSEWVHSEKAQNVWNAATQRFVVGTRVMPAGSALPTFQVQTFGMDSSVSAAVNLGDGADYYGSPSIACAANGTCLAVGFLAGINTGYSGGSYARRFDSASLAPQGLLFHLADGNPNEDQEVVYQAHTGRFLTEWFRGTGGGLIDTRLVGTDGSMSLLDLSKGFASGAGCNTLAYNVATQTSLLVTKEGGAAQLFAIELGDNGYPLDLSNQLLIVNWDGVVLDYEPSIGVNAINGQWLVTAQMTGGSIGLLIQGTPAGSQSPVALQNGNFSNGLASWSTFASPNQGDLVASVNMGVLSFYRAAEPAGPGHQAVILQPTGAAVAAHSPIAVQFDMGNSGPSRKRITVLLHDLDFSDLHVCSFWIAPNSPMRTYVMRTFTTKFWGNATVSFYAATEGFDGGYYMLDNVSIFQQQGQATDRTDCSDPAAPAGVAQADGPEMVSNGGFDSFLSSWNLFGQISSQVVGGVFQFTRPGGDPAGALLQFTGAPIAANTPLTASFQLGNSSGVRKRVTVILHDSDFSDLQACTLWLDPGQGMTPYTMRTFTTEAWNNASISFYMGSVDTTQWARIDNVSLHRTPAATMIGTQCINGNVGSGAPGGAAAPSGSGGSVAQMAATTASNSSSSSSATNNTASGDSGPAPSVTRLDGGQVLSASGSTSGALMSNAPIDLRQADSPWLQFDSLGLFGNSSAEVQVSFDGTEWMTIADLPAGSDWLTTTLDLGAYAGRTIYLRFRLQSGGGDASADQWFITNVWLGGGSSTPSKTPSASLIQREVLNRRLEPVVLEERLDQRMLRQAVNRNAHLGFRV